MELSEMIALAIAMQTETPTIQVLIYERETTVSVWMAWRGHFGQREITIPYISKTNVVPVIREALRREVEDRPFN